MSNFALVSDSTCDLDRAMREQYDIDYVRMNYVIDGTEYPASLDWEGHSAKEYYDMMRNGTRIRTTQVSRDTYTECFKGYLEKGMDVVYISCSSALSGSVNLAKLIANELVSEYPDNRVYCIDSLCSSFGQAMMVLYASNLRSAGKGAKEVADAVEGMRLNINQSGTVESLEYLRRAGRVKASKAFFGNLFGVKPIIISDIIGQNYAVKKAKGMKNALAEIAAMMKDAIEPAGEECLFISHADAEGTAEMLRDEILKVVPFKNVHIGCIGPIVGASVGPGTVIAFCYGKEVTIEGRE